MLSKAHQVTSDGRFRLVGSPTEFFSWGIPRDPLLWLLHSSGPAALQTTLHTGLLMLELLSFSVLAPFSAVVSTWLLGFSLLSLEV